MSFGESKHEFAIYVPTLSTQSAEVWAGRTLILEYPEIVHRVCTVLRLKAGESAVLFDRQIELSVQVHAADKKRVTFVVGEKKTHHVLQPAITFFLPVLKKEDLESALYSLVELGASAVQLVATEKARRVGPKEREEKELERLERIMIAAAEQSKQFALPELHAPIPFDQVVEQLKKTDAPSIFFDPDGEDLFTVMTDLRAQKPRHIFLLVGPEGDLTDQEKAQLAQVPVRACKLTPTVLRSVQAVAVGIGVVRSVI